MKKEVTETMTRECDTCEVRHTCLDYLRHCKQFIRNKDANEQYPSCYRSIVSDR